jgi:hypothetical protein
MQARRIQTLGGDMNHHGLALIVLLLMSVTFEQNPAKDQPDDLVITKINWRKEVFVPALYDDPLRPNQERDDLAREQRAATKQNIIRTKQGESPVHVPAKSSIENTTPEEIKASDGPSVSFLYQARIKNLGTRTLGTVVWFYVCVEPASGVEMGRHRFTNKINLKPGKSADLIGRSTKPVTGVVDAAKPNGNNGNKCTERVEIDRVEYDDGTLWQRPPH